MSIFSHPKLSNDFRCELDHARDADPAVSATTNAALKWINDSKADKLLFQALAKTAPPKPVSDAAGHPSLWLSPPPLGLGNHVGIVMGLDDKGNVRCVASNAVVQPGKGLQATCPKKLFEAFTRSKSAAEQTALIQQAVNAATIDQMELVEKVCTDSQRFRTMAAFLVVLTADKPLLYVSTLVISGPRQPNLALSFTGKVALP